MYVIISYQVIGWPNGWHETGHLDDPPNSHDTYDSDLELAKRFWAKMATTYGTETSIIFDLWNEPVHDAADWNNAVDDHLWRGIGIPGEMGLKEAYETLIQTVRANGAQNIVLATGNRWASWLAGIKDYPPADPNNNVAYAYHQYADVGNNNTAKWNADMGGLLESKPVIVSEWGYSDDDVGYRLWPGTWDSPGTPLLSYGKLFTDWMDLHKLSNLAWSYHHNMPPALLFKNGTLTKYGVSAKNYISAALPPINACIVTVATTGTVSVGGTVTITSNTAGINCTWNGAAVGGTCVSGVINAGTQVIMTANLPAGTSVNWGAGCDATTASTCTINALNANKIISPVTTAESAITKVLTPGRAIATWPAGIPVAEKRPVVVFLPGWGGVGAVPAVVSPHNLSLVTEGYVTLAIGFDTSSEWISDIDVKTKEGLNLLCADATIPANCKAIVLDGGSYGGIQNDLVIRYLRNNGYSGAGGTNKALGFVSEDAGYVPPGDWPGGIFSRTGLADTVSYSVAMIQNLGDTTFDPYTCDIWGNCGARILSNAHLARGDSNVYSICPPIGNHGARDYADWDAWVISAIKTMIHTTSGIPTWVGYTNPTLAVSNACVNAVDTTSPVLAEVTPVPPQTYNQNPTYTFNATEAGVITYGGDCSGFPAAVPSAGDNTITLAAVGGGPLEYGTYNNCTIIVTDAAGNPSIPLAINPFMVVDTAVQFLWVWLESGSGYYLTLQAAYGAAAKPDVLRARAAVLPEDVTFGSNKNISLRGGYNPWYETNTGGFTTIRSLTIGGPGSGNSGVAIENVIIK